MSTRIPTVLERILGQTREELERRKRQTPLGVLQQAGQERGERAGRTFASAVRADGIGVIAEFKRRSPSAGSLREAADLAGVVAAYARGGAVALSILTEGPNFGGALEDLSGARAVCDLPLLRKDFILDSYQLHEARAAGADAVLLIVAALEQPQLAELVAHAQALGLDALVEVHDEAALAIALDVGADLVGINNRDLRDFSVDTDRTERLMGGMPAGVTVVSESGIHSAGQLRRLAERGVQAVLVGESLMRAEDPAAALRSLVGS
ncbi:MAG TPA: indole-3-glycerol phosphate synthase TrpC [Solirubrobacteraceae bacterium]|nr:indole-3-glycerol phosphate synthase TrpC [Solirubrobacteraceae bacterium]